MEEKIKQIIFEICEIISPNYDKNQLKKIIYDSDIF